PAEILDIVDKDSPQKAGEVYWRWKFGVVLSTGEERVLYDNSAPTIKNTTKPGRWVMAALNCDAKVLAGRRITLDDLGGQKLYLMLEAKPQQDGSLRNIIVRVKPIAAP